MKTRQTPRGLNGGRQNAKEVKFMDKKMAERLREEYPACIPLGAAAPLLGISARQLATLVAEGRRPFSDIGVNIGIRQRYVKIYTGRLIAYLSGESNYE
jgi:DNA-binding CsgD family transcriptional regulator